MHEYEFDSTHFYNPHRAEAGGEGEVREGLFSSRTLVGVEEVHLINHSKFRILYWAMTQGPSAKFQHLRDNTKAVIF
jgi:hypothetical protein